jgi:hypothetical protein
LRSPLAGAEVLVDAASGRGDNYSMLDRRRTRGMTGCFVRRAGRYDVHADVIGLMAGNSA